MNRRCPFCAGTMVWSSGTEETARERAGNARESDRFRCSGCGREFIHSVSERFSGNAEGWSVREGDRWRTLEKNDWPQVLRPGG